MKQRTRIAWHGDDSSRKGGREGGREAHAHTGVAPAGEAPAAIIRSAWPAARALAEAEALPLTEAEAAFRRSRLLWLWDWEVRRRGVAEEGIMERSWSWPAVPHGGRRRRERKRGSFGLER